MLAHLKAGVEEAAMVSTGRFSALCLGPEHDRDNLAIDLLL